MMLELSYRHERPTLIGQYKTYSTDEIVDAYEALGFSTEVIRSNELSRSDLYKFRLYLNETR